MSVDKWGWIHMGAVKRAAWPGIILCLLPVLAGAMEKNLVEVVTAPLQIAKYLSDFEATKNGGSGARTGGTDMTMGALAAAGLHVKKVAVYKISGHGAFDIMAELELANLKGEKVESDLRYFTSKPLTKDSLSTQSPSESPAKASEKDWP